MATETEIYVTKKDLGELEQVVATKSDLARLEAKMVSKEDLASVATKRDLQDGLDDLELRLGARMDKLEASIEKLEVAVGLILEILQAQP